MAPHVATLALEDGTILRGLAFGAAADAVFELVFNTSMTGYQEILTDPSYRGQGVLFTASHIGNVGINEQDYESRVPQISAVVLCSLSRVVSNWRATRTLSDWLAEYDVPGISEVDTRFLTRKIREGGTLRAALSTQGTPGDKLLSMAREWPGLEGMDMVKQVTCAEPHVWANDAAMEWVKPADLEGPGNRPGLEKRIVVYDFGVKTNIIRHLAAHGASVMVLPATAPAEQALALNPDGILLSNGPGDPAGLPYAVEATCQLIESGVPTLGICMGHELIGLALGGKKSKLKFGHHGGNHPVKDLHSGQVWITAQNHNYVIDADSLPSTVEVTHLSLNDGSLEGMAMHDWPVFSIQFHPEASPGPHDAHGVFADFFKMMADGRWQMNHIH
jgi:carbamoyl-phosphate synthase small subunit